jgi:signal transduction histidine kinase
VVTPLGANWLILTRPLSPIDASVESLRNLLIGAALPTALLVGLVIWVTVGRALRPVAAATAREEQLVADVSHELRTPIAGIRVLLENQPDDPDDRELDRLDALASLNRVETITDQLLEIGSAGGPGAEVRPVDLDDLVQREARRLAPRVDCRIDTTGVVAGQVVGAERDLQSVVINLLTNAVRHARSCVSVTVTEQQGDAVLTVDDDGPGIPVVDRARVFERFTRLDEARSRDGGGAGLGLAIVQTIVDRNGGTVTVGDAPGGGARFVVRLPASAPRPAAARPGPDSPDPRHDGTATRTVV